MEPILGYTIQARDGELGKLHDVLFDDASWQVRYFVVDTGGILSGRKVLISPEVVETPDWGNERLPVALTKKQVEDSPDISDDPPVTLQHLAPLHMYYGWAPWWGVDLIPPPVLPGPEAEALDVKGDRHLRGLREVVDYRIAAKDGELGRVEDMLIDDADWFVRYMVVDTKKWLHGKYVLIAPEWIDEIRWAERDVVVKLSKDEITHSPAFEPNTPVSRDYEAQLYSYYRRPAYWQR
jgi:uncharacterized protein YrrD